MKYYKKIIQLLIITVLFITSCQINKNDQKNNSILDSTNVKIHNKEDSLVENSTSLNFDNLEQEDNDEFISKKLFKEWKGTYKVIEKNKLDGWGRESNVISELYLITPDSVIFKSWLTDSNGLKYTENDNYQEFIGGVLATSRKDSIEFYTKRIVSGGNNSLSPLLTVIKKQQLSYLQSITLS
ncbi:hypothetical protein [Empedobacter falsenii]